MPGDRGGGTDVLARLGAFAVWKTANLVYAGTVPLKGEEVREWRSDSQA